MYKKEMRGTNAFPIINKGNLGPDSQNNSEIHSESCIN